MQFKPKSEKEIQGESLAPKGRYDFEILNAVEEKSKKGNDMIKLKVGLYGDNGIRWHIYDYLMEAMAFKLRHFCAATGLTQRYEAGQLTSEDCIGRSGWCDVVIKEGKDGYPAKNEIKDYIENTKPQAAPKQPEAKPTAGDDDVPF